jgi:hypothetical protein
MFPYLRVDDCLSPEPAERKLSLPMNVELKRGGGHRERASCGAWR